MKPRYSFAPGGEFSIENYNFAKPFSSFLPGVAGKMGKPLWSFYVNRGQGLCSFGVENRDNMILEFIPADQAYQRTSQVGFRTFIKFFCGQTARFYEPFSIASALNNSVQKMTTTAYDVRFEDYYKPVGLRTQVEMFTLASEKFPALMREVTFTNESSEPIHMEIMDGVPKIMPYGMNEFFCKNMSRTSEAWMGVFHQEETGVPLFKLKVLPLDEAKVMLLEKGNFFAAFDESSLMKLVVDPNLIFGGITDFSVPMLFNQVKPFEFPTKQITDNRTPCAFMHHDVSLKPGGSKTYYQIIGQVPENAQLPAVFSEIAQRKYFQRKKEENKAIISEIQQLIYTVSGLPEFDAYVGQTFLDNVLRGGLPVTIGKEGRQKCVFYAYSRKHGDIERDYNQFQLSPTYFSQGNGNYRDVNQNRRSDVFFNPDLDQENIIQMMNLIQLDGYNPLVIKGAIYQLTAPKLAFLKRKYKRVTSRKILKLLKTPFSPGQLAEVLSQEIPNSAELNTLLSKILIQSDCISDAEHKEGYWSDHWTYNMDMIESYLSLFPDRVKELFFDTKRYTFFDDPVVVLPRRERYGFNENGQARQQRFVSKSPEKLAMMAARSTAPNTVRVRNGKGDIFTTNLAVKCLHLVAIKASTLDPFGVGIEMEAGKPNWYDAINGLPSVFGSSSAESFELMRWVKSLIGNLSPFRSEVVGFPKEISDFILALKKIISGMAGQANPNLWYWEESNALRERFREQTRLGLSGELAPMQVRELISFLSQLEDRLGASIYTQFDEKSGVPFTYFQFEPVNFERNEASGDFKYTDFKIKPLAHFLQGPVNYLKTVSSKTDAKALHEGIKKTGLYDTKLKMFKVCESLKKESIEIGRNKIFTPGWLENESIWMHMEYKYVLELLKTKLYNQFEEVFFQVLPPFLSPEQYGRSVTENSSFIASSANPDRSTHGQGFVARLSGSTAELIQMWLTMCFGHVPFEVDTMGRLNFILDPILPGKLFSTTASETRIKSISGKWIDQPLPVGSFMAMFLGVIPIVFHNPSLKSTWKVPISHMIVHPYRKEPFKIRGNRIADGELVRSRKIEKIEVFFAAESKKPESKKA